MLRQEAARREGDELLAFVEVEPGANIRRRAEEISAGAPLFIRGQRLDPYALGVLASMGIAEVAIHPPPRVAVITIGDELVQPAHVAADHQTYDSNSVLLSALLAELGVPLVSIVQVADEDGAIHSALQRAVAAADLVVTCGGASVGDRDRIKSVLVADGGALDFDALAMKPGKPAGLGVLEGRPVLILPGNPGAAAVAFDQLVRPALLRYQGAVEERVRVPVRLASGQRKQAGLTYLLSARREVRDDGSVWAIVRPQGAGQLLQNVDAEGWVVLPAGQGRVLRRRGRRARAVPRREGEGSVSVPSVSLIGHSDSGKTTLLAKLLPELSRLEVRTAVIKHSSHVHPLHKPGSDSDKLQKAGAVAAGFATPQGVSLHFPGALEQLLPRVQASVSGEVDLILVEGWKDGPLPKIEVWREAVGAPPLHAGGRDLIAIVTDDQPPPGLFRFRPDEVRLLAEFLAGLGARAPMSTKGTVERPVWRTPALSEETDAIALEEPLEIRLAGETIAVTMRTPGEDERLALGFLHGEGVIRGAEDVATVYRCGVPGTEEYGNAVEVTPAGGARIDFERFEATRRGALTSAACGVCGRKTIDDLLARVPTLSPPAPLSSGPAARLDLAPARGPAELRAHRRRAFRGGVRSRGRAARISPRTSAGTTRSTRWSARCSSGASSAAAALLAVSGRAGFEIVQKAAMARIPFVTSVGAASSLAIDLAVRSGLTLAAFVRDGRLNLYSHPDEGDPMNLFRRLWAFVVRVFPFGLLVSREAAPLPRDDPRRLGEPAPAPVTRGGS